MSGLEVMRLMTAIIAVESSGNDNAVNQKEQAFGSMQIRQCVLTDVNRVYGTKYTLSQMKKRSVSKTVFQKYIKMYHADTQEAASRLWNGGPGWKSKKGAAKKNLDDYWQRVKTQLERSPTCQTSPKKTKDKKTEPVKKTGQKQPSKTLSTKDCQAKRPMTQD